MSAKTFFKRKIDKLSCYISFVYAPEMSIRTPSGDGLYGMFVACGIWCLADVSSVNHSSEQSNPYSAYSLTQKNSFFQN